MRLVDYDYGAEGAYFVTICTWYRRLLLGTCDDTVRLNAIGRMVAKEWVHTRAMRPNVRVDSFVVMPNHLHGLLIITGSADKPIEEIVDDGHYESRKDRSGLGTSPSGTLGAIVRGFKGATTRHARRLTRDRSFHLGQRGFHEHIVRDMADLERVRECIAENPERWAEDQENPGARPAK
jgi:putative transposase